MTWADFADPWQNVNYPNNLTCKNPASEPVGSASYLVRTKGVSRKCQTLRYRPLGGPILLSAIGTNGRLTLNVNWSRFLVKI